MSSMTVVRSVPPQPTARPKTEARQLTPGRAFQALTPWLVPAFGLVFWQVASDQGWVSPRYIPSPWTVAKSGYHLASTGELARHVGVSTRRAAIGFAIGGGIGLALGLLNGLSRTAERLFDSTLQMVRAVPHLALIPLVILWLGIGETAKVSLVALGVIFPLYLNMVHGLRNIDPRLIELGRVQGLSRFAMLRRIVLPGALPSILVGVRYGLGLMWLSLIVAETISADSGIGYLAMNAREFLQADIVLLSIILYAMLGKLADLLTRLLERWLLPWHPQLGRR
jgi:sulfonate transport system permease protein